ncbi:ArsR family transcriptional regulator [Streptosporangium nondiastaticum]|uniref:ArsR family transcriptional regulator n=2 Tax=Actinomycetes TaxID=1760 RepID=A0A9X7JQ94_9ACTN|nr:MULTISPECIES: metalloregulator ArsR/SmtB family transcription factor [Actinomycetes]PSJ27904.1 ArsR family transcriptional regulator [Streptosporangium nondiastaticum]WKU46987.1 metalloregulator ArsR/SmtB family transcription factor [Streptomyces sp. VNUA116]
MAAGVGSFEDVEEDLSEGLGDPAADVLTEAAAAFGLLASPARLHLVWALAQGESDVTALAERVGGALPAISQHLAKLKLAGLVRSRREGRRMVYLVDDPHVVTIVRLMVGQLADRKAGAAAGAAGARGAARTGRLHGLGA